MSETTNKKFCIMCGTQINSNDIFCPNCGSAQNKQAKNSQPQFTTDISSSAKQIATSAIKSVVNKANSLAGGEGEVSLELKDLVSNVFKKHTKDEKDNVFICGTSETTPNEREISTSWPKPWLYSRVFLMFASIFSLLVIMAEVFRNLNAVPGLIFIGALAVPFSAVVFFFEVNAPRNISIFETIKIFFLGGALSLIATLILFEFGSSTELDFFGAIIVGIIEEVGKLVIVAYFCRESKTKYILNGLLIGAAVGAGFAVFETAGYALRFLLNDSWETMMSVIYLRAILSIGGHIVWAAISGAALVKVKKDEKLIKEHLLSSEFIKLFLVPVCLHSIWDMPIPSFSSIPLVQIGLTVAAWIMILVLINSGLKQITTFQNKKEEALAQ